MVITQLPFLLLCLHAVWVQSSGGTFFPIAFSERTSLCCLALSWLWIISLPSTWDSLFCLSLLRGLHPHSNRDRLMAPWRSFPRSPLPDPWPHLLSCHLIHLKEYYMLRTLSCVPRVLKANLCMFLECLRVESTHSSQLWPCCSFSKCWIPVMLLLVAISLPSLHLNSAYSFVCFWRVEACVWQHSHYWHYFLRYMQKFMLDMSTAFLVH